LNPRSSRGERVGLQRRGDPRPTFFGFKRGENADLAGEQKAQRINRVPHPASIGDHGDPFPLRQMVDSEVEIVPPRAGKPRTDFVIEPDLAVPLERALHGRPQNVIAFLVGDTPLGDDTDDVVGQFLDQFDHREIPATTHLVL
jgi:hypothetical protein